MSSLLHSLNPHQKKAVEILEGPLLILAGAGSGKTKALTHRICYLIKNGIPGEKILAVTFTNKAASEMKERMIHLLNSGERSVKIPFLGTFHSLCVRILRAHGKPEITGRNREFVIFYTNDSKTLMRQIFKDRGFYDKKVKQKVVQGKISHAKNLLVSPADYFSVADKNAFEELVASAYEEYEKRLRSNNAFDFDDLLRVTVVLLERDENLRQYYQSKWQHVLVDEYQDTNAAQYRLVQILVSQHKNICVIGDDYQSIYSFRGADFQNILNFEKDFPQAQVIKLEQNYRSTQNILANANAIISYNETGRRKNLWTENPSGDPLLLVETDNEREEGNFVAEKILSFVNSGKFRFSDCAILYRMNAQSRALEESFLRHNIPYKIVGGTKFFERSEIKDVISYLRLIYSPQDDLSFQRVINVPSRKIGLTTLESLRQIATQENCSLFSLLERIEDIDAIAPSKKQSLISFRNLILKYRESAQTEPLTLLLDHLLEDIQYEAYLDDGTGEGKSRQENVRELFSVAGKYDSAENPLATFLEGVALISDIDQVDDQEDFVTLMTIHTSKGLEFSVVFLPGWEEGIFPSSGSGFSSKEIEEERRLAYVAITRAREFCCILHAMARTLFGKRDTQSPSRFLSELEMKYVEQHKAISASSWNFRRSPQSPSTATSVFEFASAPTTRNEAIFGIRENDTGYAVGQRIRHRDFGEGTIIQISGDVLAVAFPNIGLKKFVASIAPIEILSE